MRSKMTTKMLFVFVLIATIPCFSQENCMPPATWQWADFELSLYRDECYGECPSYEITIRGNGLVTYHGRKHVSVEGSRESNLDRLQMIKLIEKLFSSGFFNTVTSFHLEFSGEDLVVSLPTLKVGPTDVPSVFLKVRIGDFEKERNIFPTEQDSDFWKLAREIDDLVGTKRWIKGRTDK